MRVLVTTSRSFLLVDTATGEAFPLDRGHGLYYGIAHANGMLYVAARNRAVSSDIAQGAERGEILMFDRELRPCGSLQAPFPLRDLHEIGWHNGRLWATCSHDNMIAVYDGSAWEQWFPLGGNLDGPGDVNHFNSFRFEGDRIWLLAHNRGDSELLAFSSETRVLAERVAFGHCAHNIWREDDQILTCSSLKGRITGLGGFLLETGGFPRGVACGENFRCVGISAMAERKARDFTTGKLMIFDGKWALQKEIPLHDEGLILDIRILPEGFDLVTDTGAANWPLPSASRPAAGLPTASLLQNTINMSDLFYRSFEERNRGPRSLIKSRLAVYLPFLEPLASPDRSAKAIDLGCGRGEWLELLRDAGFDACGVDLDEGMLAGCRAQGLDARHADALQTLRELPSDSMAVVSAFHVVEHIAFDEVRALVREALRVLKPGGLLILETPNPENLHVGTSLFYLDPSHLRPVPPQLLGFTVEYEGFHRNVIARLQESAEMHKGTAIALIDVLAGVSPDYGVVAQKHAAAEFLSRFDRPFTANYGVTLATIAHRYENQEHSRIDDAARLLRETIAVTEQKTAHFSRSISDAEELLARLERLEVRMAKADGDLRALRDSRSWRITAPLRWMGSQARLLREDGLASRVDAAVKKIIGLPARGAPLSDEAPANVRPGAAKESAAAELPAELPPATARIYADIKASAEKGREIR